MTAVQPILGSRGSAESATQHGAVRNSVTLARSAQEAWAALPLRKRLRVLCRLRYRLAVEAEVLARTIDVPGRRFADTLVAEVLPLAEAIRFLQREAPRLLAPRRMGTRGRPLWLFGNRLTLLREPLGVVLIVAPSNYPLMLPGVQIVQALAAGNAVLVKPAPGHARPMLKLRDMLGDCAHLVTVLPEEPAVVSEAMAAGVDKVFLTGSAETGEAVAAAAAERLVPAVMELSGNDAVFVCADADVELAARCIAYGRALNGGNTCIAPRRVFVAREVADDFTRALVRLNDGRITNQIDGFSIVAVIDMDEALRRDAGSDYHLGASVFGSPAVAEPLARRINAGCVVINDVIVPTADPRLPFGGRGRSGYGVTRGGEGLLEMTRVKAVARRAGAFRPHLEPPHSLDADLFRHYLAAAHGNGAAARLGAAVRIIRTLLKRRTP